MVTHSDAEAVLWAYDQHVKSLMVIYFASSAAAVPTPSERFRESLKQARARRDDALAAITENPEGANGKT